ncbi:MAG TPA: anhydro-N-acetylmuramic acid kinase [Cytophagaceae bacterium]|jgi:anhydro-N-acetylmuramic acid kinase|nr:anhydro-N-acetylmuramic acid kinase [Cytophagaceae bacterium]
MKNPTLHIHAIGLMSGTSCDGLDIAYCEFSRISNNWSYKILAAKTVDYSVPFLKKLKEAQDMQGKDLMLFDREFGAFCGKAVLDFLSETKLPVPEVIGSHGHTVFHVPAQGMTCQIGSGATLYAHTSIPVASDFRSIDVALGGQGAPLVPLGDQLLFSSYDYCLNLGGISNISYQKDHQLIAFDICPVNMVLNYLSGLLGMPYDKGGATAASAKIDDTLLTVLNDLDFYALPPPKSLGKEWFDHTFLPALQSFNHLSVESQLATCTEHMALKMAEAVKASGKNNTQRLLATGGGAFNTHLMTRFAHHLKGICTVEIPDPQTVAFKEALIFALLGALRLQKEKNVWSSATGSRRDHCGGALYGI